MNDTLTTLPGPAATLPSGLSLDEFLRRDWDQGDGLRYEWCDGKVEAGEEAMKLSELEIASKIMDRFRESPPGLTGARLLGEVELFLRSGRSYRRADLAAFTAAEVKAAGRGDKVVPACVIEIISPNDLVFHVERKLAEYFASGVQVVWHILPAFNLVRVYRSPDHDQARRGTDQCSAAPAFPDFQMTVREILGGDVVPA